MEQACTNELRIERRLHGASVIRPDRLFSPGPARAAAIPGLHQAALDLLAATAHAWGLAERCPWVRRAG